MSFSWALVIVFVISYLIGSVNFSKIVSSIKWHKNIEKEGSGNPGTMNMLRTFGAKTAIITLILEVVKAGLTAWLSAFILSRNYPVETLGYDCNLLVFFFSGFAIVLGSCFPFLGTVKGGKGVACAFGVFCFSPLWYISLALFVVGIILICITEYGFISSIVYVLGVTTAMTIYIFVLSIPYAWLICILIWVVCLLIIFKHHKNFYRLFTHQENKANFKASFKKLFHKKRKGVEEIPEDEVEHTPEKIVEIDDNKKAD